MSSRSFLAVFVLALFSLPLHAGTSNSLLDVSPDGTRSSSPTPTTAPSRSSTSPSAKPSARSPSATSPKASTWIGNGPARRRHASTARTARRLLRRRQRARSSRSCRSPTNPTASSPTKAGSTAWVTHEYPGIVSEIDLEPGKVLREIPAGSFVARPRPQPRREARSTSPSSTPASCTPSTSRPARSSIPGRATRPTTSCRHVVLHPTRPKAYLSHIRSQGQRHRRRRLDLPAAVDLRPDARRRQTPAHVVRHGHLQRRLRRDQPVGGGPLARRQAALHHLRRHQRHERLAT